MPLLPLPSITISINKIDINNDKANNYEHNNIKIIMIVTCGDYEGLCSGIEIGPCPRQHPHTSHLHIKHNMSKGEATKEEIIEGLTVILSLLYL
jgi:hypothetical protein